MARHSYLTTFQISKICEVNPTTVQNWIKEDKLRAFVTPGGHRRVRPADLVAFMKQYGMPIPDDLAKRAPLALIVDDDVDIQDLLAAALKGERENLEILLARDGIAALLLIGERKPDLVVLDIRMPGMDGYEVCRKLRSSDGTRAIKIVAITGDHSPGTRTRILEAGADLFFAKPFDIMEFSAACCRLLEY